MNKQELYDAFFGIKKSSEVFKVKITNCSKDTFWYNDKINEIFNVIDVGGEDLKTVLSYSGNRWLEEGKYIKKIDAIIYEL